MILLLRYTLVLLVIACTGCATQETRPIEPIFLQGAQFSGAGLVYIEDNRPAESRHTKGDGDTYIIYGDDKLSPNPIRYLDREIGSHYGENLDGNRVVINKFTVSMLPIIREDNLAYSIAGPSLMTALLAGPPGGDTGKSKYEYHIEGSFSGRTWWVKNHVEVTDKGARADINELLRKCNSVAITRIGDIIK